MTDCTVPNQNLQKKIKSKPQTKPSLSRSGTSENRWRALAGPDLAHVLTPEGVISKTTRGAWTAFTTTNYGISDSKAVYHRKRKNIMMTVIATTGNRWTQAQHRTETSSFSMAVDQRPNIVPFSRKWPKN